MFSVLNLGSKVTFEFLHFTRNFLTINCVPNIVLGTGNPMTQLCPAPALWCAESSGRYGHSNNHPGE